jgi:8-oxo-dGTP diphosphatase
MFQAQPSGKPEGTVVRMACFSSDYDYKGTLQADEEIEELCWITTTFPYERLTVTGIMILQDLIERVGFMLYC